MARLPKPLIGLLLGTIAFFAVWMVALKPSSSSSGGGSQGGVGQYQPAINRAHQAVKTSGQANAAVGAPTATATAAKPATPVKAPTPPKAATPAHAAPAAKAAAKAAPAAKSATKSAGKSVTSAAPDQPSAAAGVQSVQSAIRAGKVVAVLFYNGAAADDQAMKKELSAVPTHGGEVVKLAVPVAQLTDFGFITQQVQVATAPTLVLIDAAHHATTITGYADTVEISQRVADALPAK